MDSTNRIVMMGQNPRASNTQQARYADMELFRLIRRHSEARSADSLETLFSMTKKFMLGIPPFTPAWTPITVARNYLGLKLDTIAYLNLIPLATVNDRIVQFKQPFDAATRIQLELLDPAKIVVFGKGAYEMFQRLADPSYDVRYVGQRSFKKDARAVREWLDSYGVGWQ